MEEIRYEIDNTYIHYIKFGSGKKTLAVISGISLRGLEGLGGSIEKQCEALKDEYTVYVFDRRKYLKKDAVIDDLMEDIHVILNVEGIKNADFVGVSQGGMIALRFAMKYPEFI